MYPWYIIKKIDLNHLLGLYEVWFESKGIAELFISFKFVMAKQWYQYMTNVCNTKINAFWSDWSHSVHECYISIGATHYSFYDIVFLCHSHFLTH